MPIWLIAIRTYLINHLKGAALKTALLYLIKSPVLLGFRTWLIKFILEEFFEEIGEPLVKAFFVKFNYSMDRVEGEILIKRIKKAKDENNQTDYDNTTDDIFN